ncbi:MAG: hypothetical protein WCV85_03795 [Patescibacteria group bacterium]|jgi:aspartyl-tRNA(Asn)/glutamyl-tRNA(Gln) amidotransferase subunit C
MQLTPEEVEKLAKLARLELTPGVREQFADQLSKIVEYVDQVQEVGKGLTVQTERRTVAAADLAKDAVLETATEPLLDLAAKLEGRSIVAPGVKA